MPTTKTISHIGDTKFELVKDTYDAFRFTVDDKSSNPKTVMYISSEPTDSNAPTPLSTSGRVTMSNIRTEGATSTSSADVDGNIGVGGKILIREGTGTGTATRAAIYAEKDTTASNNHRLIIDPYKEDDADNSDSANNGTVYIRGNLIVEGDKTILDTAEHITSENLLGINAIRDTNGNVTGGTATAAGIHVYSGTSNTQFLYNFGNSRWRTAAEDAESLNDLEAKDVYIAGLTATGTSTLATVDINGGNIDGTAIGATTPSTAAFTTLDVTGTSTLATVDINAGSIDGTAIGATSASTAVFTTLDATGTSTLATVDINGGSIDGTAIGATSASTAAFTTLGVSGASTFTTIEATGTSTLATVDINGGNIDGTAIGATTPSTAAFTTLGVSGAVTLSSTLVVTGSLTAASGNFGTGSVTAGTFTGDLTGNVTGQVSSISNHSTDDLSEGSTNVYYTDTRVRAAISLKSGESILQYDNATGILSTNLSEGGLGGLGDITLTSVAGSDILTYDASTSKWVNSDSLTIVGETNLGPFALSKRDAANSDPDKRSIIFTDDRDPNGDTTHRIFDVGSGTDTGGNSYYKRILGDDTISVVSRGVSARTIGNIVPVELTSSGGRTSTKVITATASSVPLHADILAYYSGKAFAAGKCVAALTNGTHSSVAMFSFSVCGSVLTMVLDQEVHSSSAALNVDYDSPGTIDLNLGTATSAVYCVKVLPIMTSDSISEQV